MPTDDLRINSKPAARRDPRERASVAGQTSRLVVIRAGRASVRARLLDTPTADRIWRALPIFSTAQVWGHGEIYFQTRLESGRERSARIIVEPGMIVYSPDRDVIGVPFARTPISKAGEIRLWSPSNIWAEALDDVGVFGAVRPGEKVEVCRLEDRTAAREG